MKGLIGLSHLHIVKTSPYEGYSKTRLARVKRIKELKKNISSRKYWDVYMQALLPLAKPNVEKQATSSLVKDLARNIMEEAFPYLNITKEVVSE